MYRVLIRSRLASIGGLLDPSVSDETEACQVSLWDRGTQSLSPTICLFELTFVS